MFQFSAAGQEACVPEVQKNRNGSFFQRSNTAQGSIFHRMSIEPPQSPTSANEGGKKCARQQLVVTTCITLLQTFRTALQHFLQRFSPAFNLGRGLVCAYLVCFCSQVLHSWLPSPDIRIVRSKFTAMQQGRAARSTIGAGILGRPAV